MTNDHDTLPSARSTSWLRIAAPRLGALSLGSLCLAVGLGSGAFASEPAPAQDSAPRSVVDRSRPKVKKAEPDELLALAVQTKRAIEERLFTPDPEWTKIEADLLELPNTGIVRMQHRLDGETGWEDLVLRRGAGAYYSFATHDHSYNREPDLSYSNGSFGSGFYGINMGLLMSVGDVPLTDLEPEFDPEPSWLARDLRSDWAIFWRNIGSEDSAHGSAFRESVGELLQDQAAAYRQTYIMRAHGPREHDHLVAFRALDLTDAECTLAYRILNTWPIQSSGGSARETFPKIPKGSAWFEGRTLEQLIDFLGEVQGRGMELLLTVPEELQTQYTEALGKRKKESFADRSGFSRILNGKPDFRPLLPVPGAGNAIRFLDADGFLNGRGELRLDRGRFECPNKDAGLLLDLGEIEFEQLAKVMAGKAHSGLSAREREAHEFMSNVRAEVDETLDRPRRVLKDADIEVLTNLGLGDRNGVQARVGHTYLFRAILFDTHDHLVAFTVIGKDAYGMSLAWNVIETWPVEAAR